MGPPLPLLPERAADTSKPAAMAATPLGVRQGTRSSGLLRLAAHGKLIARRSASYRAMQKFSAWISSPTAASVEPVDPDARGRSARFWPPSTDFLSIESHPVVGGPTELVVAASERDARPAT
jgi:hypothetical protein